MWAVISQQVLQSSECGKQENSHLIRDVSAQQHPDHSSTLWALHLQLVLRVVGQAVSILHWALLCIPSTRSNADIASDQFWKQRDLDFSNCTMLLMSFYVRTLAFSFSPSPTDFYIQVNFWITICLMFGKVPGTSRYPITKPASGTV